MKVGFDQIRVREREQGNLAKAADEIIRSHKIRRIADVVRGAYVGDDRYLAQQCAVLENYARCIGLGVIRETEVIDANVLQNSKDEIRRALIDCATQLPLSDDEIASLGEMYFYLSCFRESWEPSTEGNEHELFAEPAAEGKSLRLEWQSEVSAKRLSKFSRVIQSWLKPNA
jgi:hypothetical protein